MRTRAEKDVSTAVVMDNLLVDAPSLARHGSTTALLNARIHGPNRHLKERLPVVDARGGRISVEKLTIRRRITARCMPWLLLGADQVACIPRVNKVDVVRTIYKLHMC